MKLAEGFHWVDHPTQGVIIIKVEKGLIYQIATVASRQADDKQFNSHGPCTGYTVQLQLQR